MWLTVANRYKNDPHIIYDLIAEPRDISFTDLQSAYTSLIPKIRAIAPSSLIMVTGLDWGRDINAWLDSPLPYQNLVYRTNPYNTTSEFPGYFGRIALKYPVFLGEFGTDNQLSMAPQDVTNLLNYANTLHLGWAAWHFSSQGCPCLLSDEASFTPSSYGQIVKDALAGHTEPFTLPVFDNNPAHLPVYTDFLDSGFADYSWGINIQFGPSMVFNFHPSSGLYLSTSRRIDPHVYTSLHASVSTKNPADFTIRFKSYDGSLSQTFPLTSGQLSLSLASLTIPSISGIIIEPTDKMPDPTAFSLSDIYFQK